MGALSTSWGSYYAIGSFTNSRECSGEEHYYVLPNSVNLDLGTSILQCIGGVSAIVCSFSLVLPVLLVGMVAYSKELGGKVDTCIRIKLVICVYCDCWNIGELYVMDDP